MASRIYETAIRIAAKIAPAFKSETLAAAAALSKLSTSAAKLKQAEATTETFAHLTGQVREGEHRFNTAKAALDRLAAAEKAAGGATKESTKWMAAGAKAVKVAEKELVRMRTAAVNAGAALHQQGIDTSNLVREQHRLAVALTATQAREKLFGKRKEPGEAVPIFSKLGGNLSKMKASAGSVISDLAKVAATAGVAGGALVALAKHGIEVGDEIGDTATNLALTTTALQEFRFAAERGGSSAEDFDKGFAKFNETSGDALSGNKTAVKSFNALGISMKALKKETPEGRFNLLADALGKIKDPAQRAAAAQNFLGKTSKSMVGFFAEGSKGIAEMRKQTVGLLSPQDIANAGKAKDAMQSAGAAFRGVGNILSAALLPVATRVLNRFTKFVEENQDSIEEWAERSSAWVEGRLIPALKELGPKVLDIAMKVGGLIDKGAQLVGGFGNLGIAIGALRLAPLVKSIADVGIEATRAVIGIAKYVAAKWSAVAATKALNAANGEGGGGAGLGGLGKTAGAAAGVAAAATAGFGVGTALDEEFNLSGRSANFVAVAAQLNRQGFQGGVGATFDRLTQFFKDRSVDKGNIEGAQLGSSIFNFSPVVHVSGGAADAKTQLDAAYKEFQKKEEERLTNSRRLAFD